MAREMLRLQRFYDDLLAMFGFPIFDLDMTKNEVDENASFFIYNDKGPIRKDTQNSNLLRDFTLLFVTKNNSLIDEFKIIEACNKWGLRFRSTEYDYGKIADTQEEVRTTTFYFHQVVGTCAV